MTIDERQDEFFDEDEIEELELAHVDFDLLDTTGRWFLKVLSGPNTGAEFSMQSGSSYLIGTDTATCDIVFQDLSVSRQHARLVIDAQDKVAIEDLNSRNGTFIDGEKIIGRKAVGSNALVTMGTTTFVLIDREGERKTIVSPPFATATEKKEMPPPGTAADGMLKEPLGPIQEAVFAPIQSEVERIKEEERRQARIAHSLSALVILGAITGIFIIIGVGTTMLFKTEEIPQEKTEEPEKVIAGVLKDYPSIRYSFNPATGKLLLIGHVSTAVDRSKIIDTLEDLRFVTSIDYNNIIIDEYVWQEVNQIITKNPNWRGITITSPAPGKFVLSGFLNTKKQAKDLYDYISQNFAYPDLLEKRVVVEEDVKDEVSRKLLDGGFRTVTATLLNGQLTLNGTIPNGTTPQFQAVVEEIRKIPGLRGLSSYVTEVPQRETMVNISDKYQVTGYSTHRGTITVVISGPSVSGKILRKGDILDGMEVIEIQPNAVFLEKDNVKYRIDFNK